MGLIQELLMLREDEDGIPPRIARVMRDADIKYPGADTLEKLKVAHAKQILARGGQKGADSSERALSYALGMNNLTDHDLEDIVNPRGKHEDDDAQVNWHWDFEPKDPGFQYQPVLRHEAGNDLQFLIIHGTDDDGKELWQFAIYDTDKDDYDRQFDAHDKQSARNFLKNWCHHMSLPEPDALDMKDIGLA